MARVGLKQTDCLLVSLLFALHPGSHQAVDYATGLTDLLAVFFALLSLERLFCWLQKDSVAAGTAALFLYAASMLCKETTYLLPLLGLTPFLFRGTPPPPSAIRKLLLFSVPLAFIVLWRQNVSDASLLASGRIFHSADYYAGVVSGLARNIARYFFPFTPGFMQQYHALPRWDVSDWIIAGSAAAVLFAAAIRIHAATIFAGGLWFFAGWLPVSNILPMHPSISEFALYESDHLFYFAGIGLCMAGVASGRFVIQKIPGQSSLPRRVLSFGLPAVILVSWALGAFQNSLVWSDPATLYRKVIRTRPENPGGWLNLAVHHLKKGETLPALETLLDFEKRLGDPKDADPGLYSQFSTNLAACHVRMGDWKKAEIRYRRAVNALPENFLAWHGLGLVYAKTGDPVRAARSLSKALEIKPGFVPSRRLLDSLPGGAPGKENSPTLRHGNDIRPREPGNPPGNGAGVPRAGNRGKE
jgi:hypothetical protein